MAVRDFKDGYREIINDVPNQISDREVLIYLNTHNIDWTYVDTIKKITDYNDEVISEWLNVSVRTFRSYKQPKNKFKENIREQVLLLLSLIKYGIQVFGTSKGFNEWLDSKNFYFDNKSPITFLNTVTGIRFVHNRLTAMEYGDNV